MTLIKVQKKSYTHTTIEMEGHANFAPHGSDIVCAALSTALFTLRIGLEEVANAKFEVSEDPSRGYVKVEVLSPLDVEESVLLDTFELVVKALAQQYPDNVQVSSR